MKLRIYLFDARGIDKELELDEVNLERIKSNQLIWMNILGRENGTLEEVISTLNLKNVPIKDVLNVAERPKIDIFDGFYRFFIISVKTGERAHVEKIPIDFIVGKNFVITVHDEEVEYFKHFTEQEKGETHIGELDTESFIATLLDLHIVSYFVALEEVEKEVDKFDARVLQTELRTDEFLREMVTLRQTVSKLRRWFLPHREVFYALSRPDFQRIAQSDSAENFRQLNEHFETAFEAIETSRDTVLSLFDLYATKSAQLTNELVQRLTFITLIIGMLGVIAGVFGMNFETDELFKMSHGFWMAVGGMSLLAILLSIFAKFKGWI